MKFCSDCSTRHMGVVPCGGYLNRLRSVRLDNTVTETRTKRSYFDAESLAGLFKRKPGEVKEEMDEELGSRGLAYSEQVPSGRVVPPADVAVEMLGDVVDEG